MVLGLAILIRFRLMLAVLDVTPKGESRAKGHVIVLRAARGFDCSVHRVFGWPSLFDEN